MAVDGCGVVCKYILIVFDIIFAVVGVTFLGLGLWLRFSNDTRGIFDIEALNSSAFVMGVTILIGVGSVMLIVVVFGDIGACSEKKWALQVFSFLLAFLATAEITLGVLAYIRKEEVGMSASEFYTSMYVLYVKNGGDPALGVTLTFVNKMLHCCGITGVAVIEVAKQTCPEPNGFFEKIKMPSCPVVIADVFNSKASLVVGIFIGTAALLIIALICSITLARKIRLSDSSPQYIILTQSTPVLANPQAHQPQFASTSTPQSYLDQDPVIFTPLTVANIPVAQA